MTVTIMVPVTGILVFWNVRYYLNTNNLYYSDCDCNTDWYISILRYQILQ